MVGACFIAKFLLCSAAQVTLATGLGGTGLVRVGLGLGGRGGGGVENCGQHTVSALDKL